MLVSMPCFCRISHALMPSHDDAICIQHQGAQLDADLAYSKHAAGRWA